MKKTAFFLFAAIFAVVPAMAGDVPDTGQRYCYDGSQRIPCPTPGDPYHGQDAHYTRARSYTKLDSNGAALADTAETWAMVRDDVTGLIWEVKNADDGTQDYNNPHDADNEYTWYDPTYTDYPGTQGDGTDTLDFINALNASSFGGYSDWRMPTVKELCTLIDRGKLNSPYIDVAFFPYTQTSDYYWSASTYASSTSNAWGVYFSTGNGNWYYKSSYDYVRAVRGGQ